jgi:putative ABC transport system permease protein
MIDYLVLAWKGLTHRRLRSIVTVIGIVIGIAAIVLLVSISRGFQDSVTKLFEQFGADTITIMGGTNVITASAMAPVPLTDDDVRVVERVRGVSSAFGMAAKTLPVKYGAETKALVVYGLSAEAMDTLYGTIYETFMEDGRTFRKTDKYVAILGNSAAHDIFGKDISVGRTVYINGKKFRVIGILKKAGNDQDDMSITIPLSTFKELTGEDKVAYMAIVAKLKPGADAEVVAEDVKKELKHARGQEDFTVMTTEDLLNTINSILGVVGLVVTGIAVIALIVGAVGIMNTMYMSVTERTREIGVMKAVGAKRWQILAIFLIEAGIIGAAGGILGEIVAVAIAKAAEYAIVTYGGISYYSAYLEPELLIGAAAFSFVIGIIAWLWPARHAANLDPVEALRYE